jgi:hypothetical protein
MTDPAPETPRTEAAQAEHRWEAWARRIAPLVHDGLIDTPQARRVIDKALYLARLLDEHLPVEREAGSTGPAESMPVTLVGMALHAIKQRDRLHETPCRCEADASDLRQWHESEALPDDRHSIMGRASDAGPATRSYIGRVRDTEERLIAESLRTDAGPAGIDVERLARAMDSYDPPPMFKDGMKIRSAWSRANSSDAPLIVREAERRLSRESDR